MALPVLRQLIFHCSLFGAPFVLALWCHGALADVQKGMADTRTLCRADAKAARLDAIRDKVPIFDESITPEMLALTRNPTEQELRALRLLYPIRVRCFQRIIEAYGTTGDEISQFPYNESVQRSIGALSLLINGFTTLAEYSHAMEIMGEEIVQYQKSAAEQARLQQQQLESEKLKQATLILSCVGSSPPQISNIEFQYRVDPVANTVWANKGTEAPSNIRISDSDISFKQGFEYISISRLTGMFTINANLGILVSGHCTRASEQRAF